MRRCTRHITCLHQLSRSPHLPSHQLRSPLLPSPLLTPHRTFLDISRPAKEAGLVPGIISDDPSITSKISAVDQTNPLSTVDTALTTLASDANSEEMISQILSQLPELGSDTAWVTVIMWAVGLRTLHCLYSRVVTSRYLEQSLPHSQWYYRKQVELAFWKDKRNYEKVDDVGSEVFHYNSENSLNGSPHSVRKRAAFSAFMLAYMNVCGLYFFSQVYSTSLGEATFLWLPSLLEPDPLYILPVTNLLLCTAMFKLMRQGILYSTKIPKSRLPPSVKEMISDRPITGSLFLTGTGLLAGKLFLTVSDLIPSLYLLFWTSSNLTGLLITLTVMKSNVFRRQIKLLPKQEFKLLLASNDIAIDPEVMNAEKRKLSEAEEQVLYQSKQGNQE